MARRRKNVDSPIDAPAQVGPSDEPEQAELQADSSGPSTGLGTRTRKPRIIVRFDQTGSPDLASMEPEDRKSLERAFRAQQSAAEASVDPALVVMVLQGLGSLEAALLAQKYGLEPDDCRKVVGPSEPLAGMLGQAGAKVIAKHNLTGKWGEEIALLSLLTVWQTTVLQQLRALGARKADETRGNLGPKTTGKVNSGAGSGVSEES